MKKTLSIILIVIITLSFAISVSVFAKEDATAFSDAVIGGENIFDMPKSIEGDIGSFTQLGKLPCDDTLIWSSGNEKIARVDETGQVTLWGYGECEVYAVLKSNPEIVYTCSVKCKYTPPKFYYSLRKDGTYEIKDYEGTDKVVKIPEKYKGKKVTVIEDLGVFNNFLTQTPSKIVISKNIKKIKYLNTASFASSDKLKEIKVDKNNKDFSSVNGVLFNKKKTKLLMFPLMKSTKYTVPKTVTEIGSKAFVYSKLKSVKLSSKLKTIGSSAFSGCSKLTKISIPNSVTKISEYAFASSKLKSIKLPKNLKSIGKRAFSNTKLKSIVIPKSVTKIGTYAFGSATDEEGYPYIIKSFVIKGCKGSAAEKYARKYNLTFKSM